MKKSGSLNIDSWISTPSLTSTKRLKMYAQGYESEWINYSYIGSSLRTGSNTHVYFHRIRVRSSNNLPIPISLVMCSLRKLSARPFYTISHLIITPWFEPQVNLALCRYSMALHYGSLHTVIRQYAFGRCHWLFRAMTKNCSTRYSSETKKVEAALWGAPAACRVPRVPIG